LTEKYLADTLYCSEKDGSVKKISDYVRASSSFSYENEDDEVDVKDDDEVDVKDDDEVDVENDDEVDVENDDEIDVKNDDSDNVYTSQDDASLNNDDISDTDEDLKDLNRIKNFDDVEIKITDRQKKRKAFWRNTKEWIKSYNQNNINKKTLLKFNPDKMYAREDFIDQTVLDRAIKLLFQARFGQEVHAWRISPYIKYNHLLTSVNAVIHQRIKADKTYF
jgi:hypothetical protein